MHAKLAQYCFGVNSLGRALGYHVHQRTRCHRRHQAVPAWLHQQQMRSPWGDVSRSSLNSEDYVDSKMSCSKARWDEPGSQSDLHGFGAVLCISREKQQWDRDAGIKESAHHSPGMARALAKTLRDFAGLYPKEEKRKKKSPTHKQTPSTVWNLKPINLSLREMKHKVSPKGMTTEADTALTAPLHGCLHCCSSSNFIALSVTSLL